MSRYNIFRGAATALATPFTDDGAVDLDTLGRLIDRQISAGIDAVVLCGTTGESPTLASDEKAEIWHYARERIDKAERRVPLIAGTGGNDTNAAVRLSHSAELCGADALLVVTPFYNKTSQFGIAEHYRRIAAGVSLPIIVYTVPSRTGVNISPATWRELFSIPNIVAVKDATGDLRHTAMLTGICRDMGEEAVDIYSGDDELTLPVLAYGGAGVISVASNIIPEEIHEICRLFFDGKCGEALQAWQHALPLMRALFCDVNPIPLKYAMSELGLCRPYLRLPLVPLEDDKRSVVMDSLQKVLQIK